MKALVYHGPGQRGWDTVDDPTILDPTDAVVRIDTSTICGTDLHILKGDVPETTPGTVLGHEAVGTVQEVGAGVSTVAPGDRVLMSCVSSCGRCRYCKEARYGQCLGGGGWIFGHLINGLQAEYARVPFADNSVYKVPEQLTDEQVLFLADILPTSFEVGVLNGMVSPGDVVAIVGAGPIGLAAILTARLYTPGRIVAIDLADSRLESARRFGADTTINNGSEDAVARVMELTDGLGADVAFEAVGVPQTFELAAELIRPGGRVANIGVHGQSAQLHLEKLWIRDVTITTGLVDTFSIPQLMRLISSGRLDPSLFATHRFPLGDTMSAYDTFADAANTNALKVVLQGANGNSPSAEARADRRRVRSAGQLETMTAHLHLATSLTETDANPSEPSPVRVVLADDHALMRRSLRLVLDGEEGVQVIAEAEDMAAAVRHVHDHKPDVLVLDLRMPGGSSIETIGELRERAPDTQVVVMTMEGNPVFAQHALATGALGFVLKDRADSELVQAVLAAARGEEYIGPRVSRPRLDAPSRPITDDELTAREVEVLRLIALGHTSVEIGGKLDISPRTVESHRARIHGKLGLATRAELVSYALERSLLTA